MRLAVGVAALLVSASAAAETYEDLATERVWDVTLETRGSGSFHGKSTTGDSRLDLVLATAPALTPSGRLALFVARGEKHTEHGPGDRSHWLVQPPKKTHTRAGKRESWKIPLHVEKPPLTLASELRVAPSGRVDGHYLSSKPALTELHHVSLLWPELPAKLAPGQKLTSRRKLHPWVAEEPLLIDVEITVVAVKDGVAELSFAGEHGVPRSAWRDDAPQYAHEFKTATVKVRGRAHVRVAPTEWLDAEADVSEELVGDLAPQGGSSHVTIKLTPRTDLRLAASLGAILD
jgi:hypothetical protein